MKRKLVFASEKEMPLCAVSSESMAHNLTGSWRYLRPVHADKLAPCFGTCPAGTDIPRFLHLIAEGQFLGAYQTIRRTNPLSTICGYVCYHPCQSDCTREVIDAGVSIQALERFVSEQALATPSDLAPNTRLDERVAIVGAGPAGLTCAHFLALEGVQVTVFDAGSSPGGMLRDGIPAFRLPRDILQAEVERIETLGVRFRLQQRIGRDRSFDSIVEEFDAVFVSTGAHRSRLLGITGESDPAVSSGLDFLRRVNQGAPPSLGDSVVVIGGGNTAIDTARTALRLGSQPLVVYRRTRDEMPAHPDEVLAAEAEGVEFVFLAVPTALRRDGDCLEVTFQRMRLGPSDSSGRPRPVPVPGSEFVTTTDSLLVAAGESADLSFAPGLEDRPRVFVGGDAASGPSTVPEAIASGREAALSILAALGLPARSVAAPRRPAQRFDPSTLNPAYFSCSEAVHPPVLAFEDRQGNFDAIVGGLDAERAVWEARRCLSCGVCNACDNCWVFCPEAAIARDDGRYSINLDYCKGCGICAQECPRGVIALQQEES